MRQPIFYGAVHLLFYRGDRVLLLKRINTGFEDGKWSVVAGRIDGNEEVKAAAIREAKEEAGVTIRPEDLDVVGVIHRKNVSSEWIDFYLRVRAWSGEIANMEPHKCEELAWFSLRELPGDMIGYIRTAVEKDHGAMWFESLGW
ncbi:ADP-ribose pyrophosphatase YjhB, NUDIX family [Paenibacillus sp. UNC496MF]|uniref:NUDIX hydrolase n=1 Tax=Paenibacillus sp. UNC496MF TaxID=1502753 RepID=UPI0008EF0FEC|nr:NUDIX domain-containing protein [Paenibacillus sp. UNC496MF]SFJ80075.1 ADP-ribose pyrophosphatase YjhB, NUDIX family [Paenibacillus sp. UNC496MF]